ncbi:hypothetical protein D3C86_624260 [compost metagenome]
MEVFFISADDEKRSCKNIKSQRRAFHCKRNLIIAKRNAFKFDFFELVREKQRCTFKKKFITQGFIAIADFYLLALQKILTIACKFHFRFQYILKYKTENIFNPRR